jgi:8-oxo-dGTP diphosphatase
LKQIEVAVAILLSEENKVLTSWRQPHQHQGGLWEFPGGKREPDETMLDALKREIDEELGVRVEQAEPFVRIDHDYGDKQVSLDVWLVSHFTGEPCGREGQPLRWQAVNDLQVDDFPAANAAIIEALKQAQLPV